MNTTYGVALRRSALRLLCGLWPALSLACSQSPELSDRWDGQDTRLAAKDAGQATLVQPVIRDAGPNLDAFFIDDPTPPMCDADGERVASENVHDPIPDCPEDKNREGCPCDKPGRTASCWPGKRMHRNRGQCHDGVATCQETIEFGATWGPCRGYQLPEDFATEGPAACRCFSSGEWALENLVPCIYEREAELFVTSSIPDGAGSYYCDEDLPASSVWTASTLSVECAGQFRLCYALKAGDVEHPKPDDCTVERLCVDTWYPDPDVPQNLPDLPGWRAPDDACTRRFVESGGYGEMSVLGLSAECDAVDDGQGAPYVFKRTRYCATHCVNSPEKPECKACGTGVSGHF
ncbi:MAG: hypothetical protein RL701_5928 [Pseudomonadota bacterium]